MGKKDEKVKIGKHENVLIESERGREGERERERRERKIDLQRRVVIIKRGEMKINSDEKRELTCSSIGLKLAASENIG